jgi:periplasmic protein TonB
MPADMFRPVPATRRRGWLIPVSVAAHGVAVSALFIVPLMADGELPEPARAAPIYVEVTIPTLPPAPKPPQRAPSQPARAAATSNPDAAPISVPDRIAPEHDMPVGIETGLPVGEGIGVVGVPVGESVGDYLPPQPAAQKPFRVGGEVRAPRKIHDVAPRYPVIAQQARIQGTVIIEAVIGADGRVQSARSLKPTPFLEEAALEAVRQWVFTPTKLNGEPVPVVMTVTVDFRLQ